MRWRHEHILAGAARRLKAGIDSGRDPFAVLVDCQDHVVAVARAWVDLVVLEEFADAVERCDAALRDVLDRLCSLHALHRIEAERGWFQEHGRLTPQRSKAVIKHVNALCARVRDDAELLVDAFGVPSRRSPTRTGGGRRVTRRETPRLPRAERERADARDGARAVRRARLRGRDDGRGRGRGRRHEAAALHVLRKQGAPVPRVHAPGGRRAARGRRRRRRAAATPPEALRAGIHAFFAFIDADRSAWRVLFDETLPAGGEVARGVLEYRERLEALVTARCSQLPRRAGAAPPSPRCPSRCSAPPRRSGAGGCAPARCRRRATAEPARSAPSNPD